VLALFGAGATSLLDVFLVEVAPVKVTVELFLVNSGVLNAELPPLMPVPPKPDASLEPFLFPFPPFPPLPFLDPFENVPETAGDGTPGINGGLTGAGTVIKLFDLLFPVFPLLLTPVLTPLLLFFVLAFVLAPLLPTPLLDSPFAEDPEIPVLPPLAVADPFFEPLPTCATTTL